MNRSPVTFSTEMPVAEAVERLLRGKQTGGPVIDQAGKVVGFLSEQDCLRKMIESTYYREQVARVKDVMTAEAVSVKHYASVLEVGQRMLVEKPKVYPVVDDNGMLHGTINRSEILNAVDVHLRDGYQSADS
jgi:CBS domain-containing protein